LDSTTASTTRALMSVPFFGIEGLLSRGSLHVTGKDLFCQGN
jgi:hypothetical protein